MPNAPVSWAQLSAEAREGLARRSSLVAHIRADQPRSGRTHGEAVESHLKVSFGHPDRWRIECDGEVVLLRGDARHLRRARSGVMHEQRRRTHWIPKDEIAGLGWGHPRLFLDPPEFQTPLAGPTATTHAGRDAWEVTLSAPGNKPYVLRLVLDQETGLVLRYAAEGTPYVVEVLDITVDADLSLATFTWDGYAANADEDEKPFTSDS